MRNPTGFVLETRAGELVPVRAADTVELSVGQAQRELARAPWGSQVTLLDGDGGLEPNPISLEFLAGSSALDVLSAQQEEMATRTALRSVQGLWGAGAYEGLYLPLLGASPTSRGYEGPSGYRKLPYDLYPASTRQNGIYEGWEYPPVDRAETTGPSLTTESTPDAPIYAFSANGVVGVPLGFKRMPCGTMFIGARFDTAGRYTLSSLGSTALPNSGAFGLYCDETDYYAGVGSALVRAPFGTVGGAGLLPVWAITFAENGTVSVYSCDVSGFRKHGSVPLSSIPNLTAARGFLGSSNFVGHLMPGAPRFKTPWLTHRVWDEAQLERHLSAWYHYLVQFPAFAEVAPVPAIAFGTLPTSLELVVGVKQSVQVTVRRFGGASGPPVLSAVTNDVGLRYTVKTVMDTDPDADTYTVELWPESGIAEGNYSLTLTAKLGTLEATRLISARVSLSAPALAPNTTHYWPLQDNGTHSLTAMLANAAGSTAPLVIGGLVKVSTEWDALIGDGTNEPGYGPSIVTRDAVANMANDHTVTWKFRDTDRQAVGTVLFSLASPSNKFEFWQVYKSATGLRVRTSTGSTVQTVAESGPIQIPEGVQHVSVSVDVTGVISIINPKTDERQSTPYVPMSGMGRLTLFGTKLSDGTVQGLSKGIALVGVVQNALVT